jgi:hypothetical protein
MWMRLIGEILMVRFSRFEWQKHELEGHPGHYYHTCGEMESLDLDSDDINVIFAKAKELKESGWYEVHITGERFDMIYDHLLMTR